MATTCECKGSPSLGWILRYVFSELFLHGNWKRTIPCILPISFAVVYILVPWYYIGGVEEYNRNIAVNSLSTKVIVNCQNVQNPSTFFTEEKINGLFGKDARVMSAHEFQYMEVTVSTEGKEPFMVQAVGILPNSLHTTSARMENGTGISSADSREAIIPRPLALRLWGTDELRSEKMINLSVSRTSGEREERENFNLKVVGIFKSNEWNEIYIPLQFMKHISLWHENKIDKTPEQRTALVRSVPQVGYESGIFFCSESIPQEKLDEYFRHYKISATRDNNPFYEISADSNDMWFRVVPKSGSNFTASQRGEIARSLHIDCLMGTSFCKENVELYLGRSRITPNVMVMEPNDPRLAGIEIKSGKKVSDIIMSGGVIVSEEYLKRLESLDTGSTFHYVLASEISPISNQIPVAGVMPAEGLGGGWDMACSRGTLALALHRNQPETQCIVASTDLFFGMEPVIQKAYGNRMDTGADVVCDVIYPDFAAMSMSADEMPFSDYWMKRLEGDGSGLSENIRAPSGCYSLFWGRVPVGMFTADVLFTEDALVNSIVSDMKISLPPGTLPLIAVASPNDSDEKRAEVKKNAGILSMAKSLSFACTLSGECSMILLPRSASRYLGNPSLSMVGFIGRHTTSMPPASGEFAGKPIVWKKDCLMYASFLFKVAGGREEAERYFRGTIKPLTLFVAEVQRMPALSKGNHTGFSFAAAEPQEIRRLPFNWAKEYSERADAVADGNSFKDTVVAIGSRTLAVRRVTHEPFPEKTVILPMDSVVNNVGLAADVPGGINRIDIMCPCILGGRVFSALEAFRWAKAIPNKRIVLKKYVRYEFRDAASPDGKMGNDLIPALASCNPPFASVMPVLSVDAKSDTGRGFSLVGTRDSDLTRFRENIITGGWASRDGKGIVAPYDAIMETAYKDRPHDILGRNIRLAFERKLKRSIAEPRLEIVVRVNGVVAGNSGYMDIDTIKNVILWQEHKVEYDSSGRGFVIPSDLPDHGSQRCVVFLKDVSMVQPFVMDMSAKGMRTIDTLDEFKKYKGISTALKFLIAVLIVGMLLSGINSNTAITYLNKLHRLEVFGNLKAYGAGNSVILSLLMAEAFVIALAALLIGTALAILVEMLVRPLVESGFSIGPDILHNPMCSVDMLTPFLVSLALSMLCCQFGALFSYMMIRKRSVVEIFRRQF